MSGKSRKRSKGLSPDLPACEAARRTIDSRLRAVERLIGEAGDAGGKNGKMVHRLRVSTRRAAAAIQVYADCTSKKQRRKTKDRLRRVRGIAGEARMCDVQIARAQRLLGESDASLAAPLGVAIGLMVAQRRGAAGRVGVLREDRACGIKAMRRRRKRLLDSIRKAEKGSNGTLLDLATRTIAATAERMREAGEADLTIVGNVHALRIAGKRVRYTVEAFECCLEPEARETLLRRLAGFQDLLGDLNDLWELKERVDGYAEEATLDLDMRDSLRRLALDLSGRCDRAHRTFLESWGRRGIASIFGEGGVAPDDAGVEHRPGVVATDVLRFIENGAGQAR